MDNTIPLHNGLPESHCLKIYYCLNHVTILPKPEVYNLTIMISN